MVDFTTLTINAIPLSIVELENTIAKLHSQNELLRNILIAMMAGGLIIITYKMYQKNKKDEKR